MFACCTRLRWTCIDVKYKQKHHEVLSAPIAFAKEVASLPFIYLIKMQRAIWPLTCFQKHTCVFQQDKSECRTGILKKFSVGYVASNRRLDFGSDPNPDTDSGILKGILPLWHTDNCTNVSYNSRSCRQICMKFFEEWDVSLAKDHSISVLIRLTIRIQEFLTEFLPLRYREFCRISCPGGGLRSLSASSSSSFSLIRQPASDDEVVT